MFKLAIQIFDIVLVELFACYKPKRMIVFLIKIQKTRRKN